MRATVLGFGLMAALPVWGFELAVPGGAVTAEVSSPADSVRLPDGPWVEGGLVPETEGAIRRRAVRAGGSILTTLQLISPIRDALEADGYEVVFDCADVVCGGFDFRFQLDILGEPEMHVDLGDYRYLLARKQKTDDDEAHAVSVVVSRGSEAGFVHVTEVYAAEKAPPATPLPDISVTESPKFDGDLGATLEAIGHVVLSDLDFGSGASDLGAGPFESLQSLADWLAASPGTRVAIVGHTDAVGSLEANTALSQRRADAVRSRLLSDFGVADNQVSALGAGYLAPIATNATEEGRAANRRVEVVLLEIAR